MDLVPESWIRDRLIPLICRIFGKTSVTEFSRSVPKNSFFASELFFLRVKFSDIGPDAERSFVIKVPAQQPEIQQWQNCDLAYSNERLFYEELKNSGYPSEDYPKFFHDETDETLGFVIVLENLAESGYSPSPQMSELSIEYSVAALRKLGRFHASGYALKELEPKKYRELAARARDLKFEEFDPENVFSLEVKKSMLDLMPHIRARVADPGFLGDLENLFEDTCRRILYRCSRPVGDLAVIVHGDYLRNNLLFKRTKDGQLDAKIVDFGMIFESMPAVDLSTLIYQNCPKGDILNRLDVMLRAYHDSLIEWLGERGVPVTGKYAYEAFWRDFEQRAVFGLVIAAFFKHYMIMFEKHPGLIKTDYAKWMEVGNQKSEVVYEDIVDLLLNMHGRGFFKFVMSEEKD